MTVPGYVRECLVQPQRRDPRLRRPDRRRADRTVRGHRRPAPSRRRRSTSKGRAGRLPRRARQPWRPASSICREDRKGKGLLLQQDLRTNLTLAALERFTRGPFIDARAEDAALDKAIGEFDIRDPPPRPAGRPALRRQPAEAAAGQDDAARTARSSSSTSRRAASTSAPRSRSTGSSPRSPSEGRAVIVISSEMQELIGLCHRILVMRDGPHRRRGRRRAEMTEDAIVVLATGVHEERAAEIAGGQA